MGSVTVLSPAANLHPELRKFTYGELLAMERAGIIGEDERVELLGGQIYKMTIKPPHAHRVSRCPSTVALRRNPYPLRSAAKRLTRAAL
jgi:hypothetical protein